MSDNNSTRKPFKDKQAPKGPPAALFIWLLIIISIAYEIYDDRNTKKKAKTQNA